MRIYYFLFASLLLLIVGCTSSTLDDFAPVPDEEPDVVTYQQVRSTFENICTQCHSNPPQNGAPMPLEMYVQVREAVLNRGLLDRISRPDGAPGLMPNGGPRLPQATIDQIVQWEADGLLEN